MKRSPSSPSREENSAKKVKTVPFSTPSAGHDAEGWTRVEKRKNKKAKKLEQKHDLLQARFMYANSEIIKRHRAIGIEEIRDLVLHIVADAPPPNWLRVENASLMPKVVVLLIPGLTNELLSLPPLPTSATQNANIPISIPLPSTSQQTPSLPFIASTFSHACPTLAPGDSTRMHSIFGTFFSAPVTGAEKQRQMALREASEREFGKDPVRFLLTLDQMIENDYPIPSYMSDVFEKPVGWVETPKPAETPLLSMLDKKKMGSRKIYCIDCEMCLTEDGKELTRVAIIDYHSGLRIYDQLVKPAKPIVDYLTKWSGITAEALGPVTTTIAQVQEHILRLLSPPAPNPFATQDDAPITHQTPILVGHSLESDLKALKLSHPCCIDTAVIFHHPRGRPLKPGLAWLTKKWCGREIQNRGEGGHDPEEDARACLELLQKKVEHGTGFGEFKVDFESIFDRLGRAVRRAGPGSIKSAVVDHGIPGAMHGSKATTSVACQTDEEVLQGFLDNLPTHHFLFARFVSLANTLGWITPRGNFEAPVDTAPTPPPETLAEVLQTLDKHVKAVHAALPPRTALIIFSGHSDPRKMASLSAKKNAFENAIKNGRPTDDFELEEKWTTGNGRELEEAVERAKRGLLFLGVKS